MPVTYFRHSKEADSQIDHNQCFQNYFERDFKNWKHAEKIHWNSPVWFWNKTVAAEHNDMWSQHNAM